MFSPLHWSPLIFWFLSKHQPEWCYLASCNWEKASWERSQISNWNRHGKNPNYTGLKLIFRLSMKPTTTIVLAIFSILAAALPANAILNYNIYERLGNLVVETNGSLQLSEPIGDYLSSCNPSGPGVLAPTSGLICTGPSQPNPRYRITGPSRFGNPTFHDSLRKAQTYWGLATILAGNNDQFFSISSLYSPGTQIISGISFNGKDLSDVGLSMFSGTIASWSILSTGDKINVVIGQPVPGPLPVLGAGAAFGFSRYLRRRIKSN